MTRKFKILLIKNNTTVILISHFGIVTFEHLLYPEFVKFLVICLAVAYSLWNVSISSVSFFISIVTTMKIQLLTKGNKSDLVSFRSISFYAWHKHEHEHEHEKSDFLGYLDSFAWFYQNCFFSIDWFCIYSFAPSPPSQSGQLTVLNHSRP